MAKAKIHENVSCKKFLSQTADLTGVERKRKPKSQAPTCSKKHKGINELYNQKNIQPFFYSDTATGSVLEVGNIPGMGKSMETVN